MKRIIYCSQAVCDLTGARLITVLEASRRNNDAAGVTGMLPYSCQSFLQVLDGDSGALSATLTRISTDVWHARIRVLYNGEAAQRLFPDWTMGFCYVDEEDLAGDLAGFTPFGNHPLINPNLLPNAGFAVTLLKRFARNGAL